MDRTEYMLYVAVTGADSRECQKETSKNKHIVPLSSVAYCITFYSITCRMSTVQSHTSFGVSTLSRDFVFQQQQLHNGIVSIKPMPLNRNSVVTSSEFYP